MRFRILLPHTQNAIGAVGSGRREMGKRSVQQAVFDSKEATRAAKAGHQMAVNELALVPRHMLGEGNPNHPRYDLHIFGVHADEFMAKQYRATSHA